MSIAFIMVNTDLDVHDELCSQLRTIPGIIEANEVYGIYDIIIKIEFNNMEKLKETVSTRIRSLDGVKSTLTMISAD